MQFERVSEKPIDRSSIRRIEERFEVQVAEKSKLNCSLSSAVNMESAFIIRTHEANLHRVYKARICLLREDDRENSDELAEDEETILNEYAFMDNFFE